MAKPRVFGTLYDTPSDDSEQMMTSDESRTLELKRVPVTERWYAYSLRISEYRRRFAIFCIAPKPLKIIGQEVTDNNRKIYRSTTVQVQSKFKK